MPDPIVETTTTQVTNTPQGVTKTETREVPHAAIGFASSEFWLSVLGAIIGLVLCFHPKDSMNEYGILLIGTCVGVYSLSRGIAKITLPGR